MPPKCFITLTIGFDSDYEEDKTFEITFNSKKEAQEILEKMLDLGAHKNWEEIIL